MSRKTVNALMETGEFSLPEYRVRKFWSFVDKSGDCWNWTGSRDKDGYGYFAIWPICPSFRSHRLAYYLRFGAIPSEKLIMHSCDNPSCVNPGHLSIGTELENIEDRDRKRRTARQRGEKNAMARITEFDVAIAFFMRASGSSQEAIGETIGIGRTTVGQILAGRRWGHVVPKERLLSKRYCAYHPPLSSGISCEFPR